MSEHVRDSQVERLTVRIPTAMAMLSVSRSKLYKLMDSGEIATVKAGRARLIVLKSLTDFVTGQAES